MSPPEIDPANFTEDDEREELHEVSGPPPYSTSWSRDVISLFAVIGLLALVVLATYAFLTWAHWSSEPPVISIRDGLLFIRDEVLSLIADFGVLTTTLGALLLMLLVIRLFSSFIGFASVSALAIYAYLNWPNSQITTFIREKALSFDRGILTTTLGLLLLMLLVIGRVNSLRSAVYSSRNTIVGELLGEFRRHSVEFGQIEVVFNQKFDAVSSRLEIQTRTIRELHKELHQLRADNITLLTLASEIDSLASQRFQRILPVSCYTSTDNPAVTGAVEESVVNLMAAIGFDSVDEGTPEAGSWYKKLWFRTRDQLSKPEVQDRLAKVERALELKLLDSPQSKVDLDLSKAALNLTKALDKVPEGIISLGSLFVVKKISADGKPRLAILSLTQEQMELVKSHPKMKTDPAIFHDMLENQPAGMPLPSPLITPTASIPLTDRPPSKRGRRQPRGAALDKEL